MQFQELRIASNNWPVLRNGDVIPHKDDEDLKNKYRITVDIEDETLGYKRTFIIKCEVTEDKELFLANSFLVYMSPDGSKKEFVNWSWEMLGKYHLCITEWGLPTPTHYALCLNIVKEDGSGRIVHPVMIPRKK